MQTACALPRRLFTRSRSVSNVMYPSPSIASAFNRRVAEVGHYFLGVALLPCLRVLAEQLQACSQQVSALLHTLAEEPGDGEGPSDVAIVLSLPGVGRKITAWLFAEAAQPLAERDYQVLRTHGGGALVTKQSGKRRVVVMRRGCNPRLRHALYHMARVAMQRDAHFNRVYTTLRAKGQRHGQALRRTIRLKARACLQTL